MVKRWGLANRRQQSKWPIGLGQAQIAIAQGMLYSEKLKAHFSGGIVYA